MLSPAPASVAMARNCADWPLLVATALTPPSSAAMRFSSTSVVGFCGGLAQGGERWMRTRRAAAAREHVGEHGSHTRRAAAARELAP
jgi:hypothetical protein